MDIERYTSPFECDEVIKLWADIFGNPIGAKVYESCGFSYICCTGAMPTENGI